MPLFILLTLNGKPALGSKILLPSDPKKILHCKVTSDQWGASIYALFEQQRA
jgi:hypothetical protein